MTEQPDYFSNHSLKLRFPWRLYHGPIVQGLQKAVTESPGPAILNLGSGPFLELSSINPQGRKFTVCDVDPRAIEEAKKLWGSRLDGADVAMVDEPLPYSDNLFDTVVSMDVIEHVPDPVGWTREALRVLKPGGQLFLTTPNYASLSFRLIENTALEAVARFQGFSRKHIHPTKMTPERLRRTLVEAGAGWQTVASVAFGWVLTAHAFKAT